MDDTLHFSVLLGKNVAHDPMVLAKALAAVRKTPLQDQIIFAKNCWGFLADKVGQGEAMTLHESLTRAGVATVVCPSSAVVTLPAVEPAAGIGVLPPEAPALLAAAAIKTITTTTKQIKEGPGVGAKALKTTILLTTGIPIPIGGKTRIVEKTTEHSEQDFYVDIVYKNPARRLRVAASHFDYSFLKERKLYQVFGNFKLMLADLIKTTPAAWQNYGTRVLIENKPVQTMGYNTLADMERESRWLLTLANLV